MSECGGDKAIMYCPHRSAGGGEGEGGDGEKESDGEGEGGVETEERELSLAEMFEQIRHCRYIRHYHPNGTAAEDY